MTVVDTESDRVGFAFWYRNPQQPGPSSLGIAYLESDEHKILRPDFLFFAEQDGKVRVDLIDPHSLHLADALPKLKGLSEYAENHSDIFRRIESVAEVKGKLRSLDLRRKDVREAIASTDDPVKLFTGNLADDYK